MAGSGRPSACPGGTAYVGVSMWLGCLENFRNFEARDPFGEVWEVTFLGLQTAISIRHSDSVDVKFALSGRRAALGATGRSRCPHPCLLELSRKTGGLSPIRGARGWPAGHLQHIDRNRRGHGKDAGHGCGWRSWKPAPPSRATIKSSPMAIPEPAVAFMAAQIERLRKLGAQAQDRVPGRRRCARAEAAGRLARRRPGADSDRKPPASALGRLTFIDPGESPLVSKYAAIYYERRRSKGLTQMEAGGVARRPAALRRPDGDGGRRGWRLRQRRPHHRPDYVRSILQCIDLRPGTRRLSSVHIMRGADAPFGHRGLLAFSDAAIIGLFPLRRTGRELAIATAETVARRVRRRAAGGLLSFLDQRQREA